MAFAKRLAKNHNAISGDKCNITIYCTYNITCNKITKCSYKKLQNDWYCRQCIGKVMPFSNMTDMQLNRLMKERYLISQKLISEQDQILFSDEKFSFATNDYSTPEEFSKFIDYKSPSHLYLHEHILIILQH